MTYHIECNARPINDKTFASVEDAVSFAKAPKWVGGNETEITMLSEMTYTSRGTIYTIVEGDNPTAVRRESRSNTTIASMSRRNPRWLTREMDRIDSDY